MSTRNRIKIKISEKLTNLPPLFLNDLRLTGRLWSCIIVYKGKRCPKITSGFFISLNFGGERRDNIRYRYQKALRRRRGAGISLCVARNTQRRSSALPLSSRIWGQRQREASYRRGRRDEMRASADGGDRAEERQSEGKNVAYQIPRIRRQCLLRDNLF